MKIVFSAWLPRSHLHVLEVYKNLGKLDVELENIKLGKNLSFRIKKHEGLKNIDFFMDSAGQYSFITELIGEVTDTANLLKNFLLEKLIKVSHKTTYKQIKKGILPFVFSISILSSKRSSARGVKLKKIGDYLVHLEKLNDFYLKKYNYVIGKENEKGFEIAKTCNFISCATEFFYKLMDLMSDKYKLMDDLNLILEESVELSVLKKTIVDLDVIKKNIEETNSKIKQTINIIERKKEMIESLLNKKEKEFFLEQFKSLEGDVDYIETLWDLLSNYVENMDQTLNARLSFQESVESKKIEAFLSVDAASIIAALVASMVLSQYTGLGVTGINALKFAAIFFVAWMLVFLIINKIKISKKEIEKKSLIKKIE